MSETLNIPGEQNANRDFTFEICFKSKIQNSAVFHFWLQWRQCDCCTYIILKCKQLNEITQHIYNFKS